MLRAALDAVAPPPGGFDVQIDAGLPLVRADATQLERALANVLDNAGRYAGGDPVTVRARAAGGRLLLRIGDRGPGIAREELERIFEPFHSPGERRRHRARAGDRARLRGGQRRAHPRRVAAGAGHDHRGGAAGARRAARRGEMSAGRRVLVCDDELQILRALRVILRDAGFEVVTAQSAQEALDAAALRAPDAAILDLILPDGNGIEVCRSIREWSQMPILVLSAVGEESEKIRALDAGADDYVTKPFAPGELVARLNAALRRADPRRGAVARGRRPRDRPGRAPRVARRPGDPPDPQGVRPAARAGPQPRPADDTPRAAAARSGATPTRRTPTPCACTWRTCAARSSATRVRRAFIRTDPGIGYRFAAS